MKYYRTLLLIQKELCLCQFFLFMVPTNSFFFVLVFEDGIESRLYLVYI